MICIICVVITMLLLYNLFVQKPQPALSLFFLLIISCTFSVGKASADAAGIKMISDTAKSPGLPDSIISITNLGGFQKDSAKINEIIAIKIRTTKPLTSFSTLYVNEIKIDKLKPWQIHDYDKTVFFKLDPKVQDLVVKFLQSQAIDDVEIPVFFGAGDASRAYVKSVKPIVLEVKQKINLVWVWVMVLILVVLLYVGLTRNILKDDNNLYYSLGRAQLLYWTFLFAVAYLFICGQTGSLPDIPTSILTIIGISVASTAASKVIENNHKEVAPIDPKAKSEGFFIDIMSDGTSINIQRFQNVVFNVLFGIIFIQKTVSSDLMPDFDKNVLLLLGISAGTYAGLKATEATKEQNKQSPQVNSDNAPQATPASAPAETTNAGTATSGTPPADATTTDGNTPAAGNVTG